MAFEPKTRADVGGLGRLLNRVKRTPEGSPFAAQDRRAGLEGP